MNGSLRGKLYEANSREKSLQEQEENRTYRISFERDLRETDSARRDYFEVKNN